MTEIKLGGKFSGLYIYIYVHKYIKNDLQFVYIRCGETVT